MSIELIKMFLYIQSWLYKVLHIINMIMVSTIYMITIQTLTFLDIILDLDIK